MSIYKVKEIIEAVSSTNSRNEKESLLEQHKDNQLFKTIMKFVYDPYIVTGLSKKKINKKTKSVLLESEGSIIEVVDYLRIHNSGRDSDITHIQNFIYSQPTDLQDLYTKIVTKDLIIGITADTFNKVYGDNFISVFDVMLAKKFEDHSNKIKPGDRFTVTKKLDGNRLIIIKENGVVKSFTRTGKQYEGLEDIEADFTNLPANNIVFDGELIADLEGSTQEVYAETTSKARSKGANKKGLLFYVFDAFPLNQFQSGKSTKNHIERKTILSHVFENNSLPNCREVKSLYVGDDLSQINFWMNTAREQEWEGLMVNLDRPYVCKRSDVILKVKVFCDADVRCLDVLEGTGKNVGKLGAITIQFEHENELHSCNCGSGFNDEERELYWEKPELIVGKIVTVGYFEISKNSEGGYGLRFPTWKSIIRHDKTEISMN